MFDNQVKNYYLKNIYMLSGKTLMGAKWLGSENLDGQGKWAQWGRYNEVAKLHMLLSYSTCMFFYGKYFN